MHSRVPGTRHTWWAALALALALSSCANIPQGTDAKQGPPAVERIGSVDTRDSRAENYHVSRPRTYSTIAALSGASTIVVNVRGTSTTTVEYVEDFPFTIRTFEVLSPIRGAVKTASIRVRELGLETQRGTTEAGRQYVLFLVPFEFTHGVQHDGQFVTVGGPAGVYRVDGDQAQRTDDDSPDLPNALPLAELERQVAAAS